LTGNGNFSHLCKDKAKEEEEEEKNAKVI